MASINGAMGRRRRGGGAVCEAGWHREGEEGVRGGAGDMDHGPMDHNPDGGTVDAARGVGVGAAHATSGAPLL